MLSGYFQEPTKDTPRRYIIRLHKEKRDTPVFYDFNNVHVFSGFINCLVDQYYLIFNLSSIAEDQAFQCVIGAIATVDEKVKRHDFDLQMMVPPNLLDSKQEHYLYKIITSNYEIISSIAGLQKLGEGVSGVITD